MNGLSPSIDLSSDTIQLAQRGTVKRSVRTESGIWKVLPIEDV
jgi:hypothetical protein